MTFAASPWRTTRALTVAFWHDAVEDHFRVGIAFDAIETEDLAFLNLEMTAIGYDDGVHGVDCDLSDEKQTDAQSYHAGQ